jgi:putative phosphoesterase
MLPVSMRIGIVSDTHNQLRNCERIVEIFNAARVERVVHTGDITQAKTLRVLAGLDAPLCGVYGNNDLERPSLEAACAELGLHFVDPPLRVTWAGRRIAVLHDPLEIDASLLSRCHVVLHGHDHRRVVERRNGALVVNPGECAGHMPGYNAVALLDLASLRVEIENF